MPFPPLALLRRGNRVLLYCPQAQRPIARHNSNHLQHEASTQLETVMTTKSIRACIPLLSNLWNFFLAFFVYVYSNLRRYCDLKSSMSPVLSTTFFCHSCLGLFDKYLFSTGYMAGFVPGVGDWALDITVQRLVIRGW